MSLFPILLKLAARPCVVIGAGNLAESKIESLRAANARITVIAPQANERIQNLAAAGEIEFQQRPYADGDLTGSFLVVAATNVPSVNRAVFAEHGPDEPNVVGVALRAEKKVTDKITRGARMHP